MKKTFLVLLASIVGATMYSQSIETEKSSSTQEVDYVGEMENNYLTVRQKPSTEGLLSDYLRSADIQEDTVYAILYIPAECYRCEVAIPAFYEKLKENSPDNKMLLISAYADSTAAQWYNEKNGYKSDYYLYDTESDYKKIFSFNSVAMYGLYVMKLCPQSGILLTGGQYTVLGKEFIKQLVACRTRMSPHLYSGDTYTGTYTIDTDVPSYPWKTREYPLEQSGDFIISDVYDDIPKFENGHFFYTDLLNMAVMLFEFDGERFNYKTLFQADDYEKMQFVAVSDSLYQHLVEIGQVFNIALSSNMIDENHLAISYSLPKILLDQVGEVSNLSFYNAPAILVRDIDSFQSGEMICPDFYSQSDYFFMHFTFDLFDNKLWFGCQKLTWPMDGFGREDIEGIVELDPFDEGFYDTFNPIVASFDVDSGECVGLYGDLDESQRKSKTGYYFIYNVFAHYKDSFVYGNGYTGKLYVSDNPGTKDKCYEIFNVYTTAFAAPDSSKFYEFEYGSLYHPNFNRCITVVKMNDEDICCLVKYGEPKSDSVGDDRYSFVTVNRKTGEMQERFLPVITPDLQCKGYGIRSQQDKYSPFIFVKDGKDYKILDLQLSEP